MRCSEELATARRLVPSKQLRRYASLRFPRLLVRALRLIPIREEMKSLRFSYHCWYRQRMDGFQILNMIGAVVGMTVTREYLSWRKKRLATDNAGQTARLPDTRGEIIDGVFTEVPEVRRSLQQGPYRRRLTGPSVEQGQGA